MLDDALLPVPDSMRDVLTWVVDGIARPGSWLSGAQRIGVAEQARASLTGESGPSVTISDELAEVAHAVAEAPADITPDWIDELEARGLNRFGYVEATGVVSRMSVVGTIAYGLAATPPPLPPPTAGKAPRVPRKGAIMSNGWIPTVGRGHALSSLSAVAEEQESMLRLSDVIYLERVVPVEMVEKGGLVRSQIEVLAARTSYLNDCFTDCSPTHGCSVRVPRKKACPRRCEASSTRRSTSASPNADRSAR
jgi:hypothetical protein